MRILMYFLYHFIIFTAYLKEPQATPLIPSNGNGNSNVIAYISRNPSLFVVSCVAIMLFLVLVAGLFLMGFSRYGRRPPKDTDKLQSTQHLVQQDTATEDLRSVSTGSSPSYNKDRPISVVGAVGHSKTPPILHFPLPPLSRPTSSSARLKWINYRYFLF